MRLNVAADHLAEIGSDKLRAIAVRSLILYAACLAKAEPDILHAIETAREAADDDPDGKMPKVRVAHSLVLDFEAGKQSDKVAVAVRKTQELTKRMADPDQPELFEN